MTQRIALIFGISGQDGAYLTQHLIDHDYAVHGASRDATSRNFEGLRALGVKDRVTLHSASTLDRDALERLVAEVAPDEIYNLGGQSSVGLSFDQPLETFHSNVTGTANLLETIRLSKPDTRFYNACSGECFGDLGAGEAAEETTAFRPISPYAAAKATAFWMVVCYRESYNLHASSGILFNHESPLRPARFVTRKIVAAAARIAAGSDETLTLGDTTIRRDWGWAPEYMEAVRRMVQLGKPEDFVMATGVSHSLQEFVAAAFDHFGLNWADHVTTDRSLFRPSEIHQNAGNAAKAARLLDWRPTVIMPEVVARMAEAEAARV